MDHAEAKPSAVVRRGLLKTAAAGALVGGFGLAAREAEAQAVAWKQPGNNARVIELQDLGSPPAGTVRFDYFGHCGIRLTSPAGLTLLFDPWRNDPSGYWGVWYPKDFPRVAVDAVLSTHAHFDHDAVDKVDATMVLDRMVGSYRFADVAITGIADKHACSAPCWYKWTDAIKEFGQDPCPPNNPGHMDMVMYVVETGGIRTLIWGDNRHNPPEGVWAALGRIDVLTLPVDGSQHILSYDQADAIVDRLRPRAVVPTHYLCHATTITLSTLQPADEWVDGQASRQRLGSGALELQAAEVGKMSKEFLYFGDNVVSG